MTTLRTNEPIQRSIALTSPDAEAGAELRSVDADLWRTLAAWLWMAYLLLVSGAVLWWFS